MIKYLLIGIFFLSSFNFVERITQKYCQNYFYTNFCFTAFNDEVKLIYDEAICGKLDPVKNKCWIIDNEIYLDKNEYYQDLYLKHKLIIPFFVISVLSIFLTKYVKFKNFPIKHRIA